MAIFQVDVTFTDRERSEDGRYVTYRSRISVLASGEMDARQAAEQICLALRSDLDPMVLGSSVVL